MLLSNDEYNLEDIDYTEMYISIKRDGVRAEITNQGIKNRSLKILRNKKIQEFFKNTCRNLPDDIILEAEIYCDGVPCREMAGICNSLDKEVPEETKVYIFGVYDKDATFTERIAILNKIEELYLEGCDHKIVTQLEVNSKESVELMYNTFIEEGFEGAVIMDGRKKYKEGRVTIKQHIGYKLKNFQEDDFEIIGVTERLENTNESEINELGHKFKRNTVFNKKSTGIAATFIVKLPNDKTSGVTITGTEKFRKEI